MHYSASVYKNIVHSQEVANVMIDGKIMKSDQSMALVLKKLGSKLVEIEKKFGAPSIVATNEVNEFLELIEDGVCILGSPLLTNIAHDQTTLGSCTAVPCRFDNGISDFLSLAEKYYQLNMGSGFDLTTASNPVEILVELNQHAKYHTEIASFERYIGNIAHVDVRHPSIVDFINAKVDNDDIRHFNTSINIDLEFMTSVNEGGKTVLLDGNTIPSSEIWDAICHSAWKCGDPGLICLDRYNESNSVENVSPYITTAPCAEAGLAEGESCVFGYINLAACIDLAKGSIDTLKLETATRKLTRVLDNAIEISLGNFPTDLTNKVMRSNRKVGIGLCGYADALLWLKIEYGSDRACEILNIALSTINYYSKTTSYDLAQCRGEFPNFRKSKYHYDQSFLSRFSAYSNEYNWELLAKTVQEKGIRNAMTVTLPPSGRTSIMLGVNSSIEPFFDNKIIGNRFTPFYAVNSSELSKERIEVLTKTAAKIDPVKHLKVVAEATNLLDDGVSKTINLSAENTVEEVSNIFKSAWDSGLKAISIYRNNGD